MFQDREKQNLRYVPPAPRPHYVRSAPTQTRLIHSRFGVDSQDLDNSFQLLMSGGNNATTSIFRSTFDIQERLGFGSFGDVFRVRSKLNQKEYAVKKSRRMYIGEADRHVVISCHMNIYLSLHLFLNLSGYSCFIINMRFDTGLGSSEKLIE